MAMLKKFTLWLFVLVVVFIGIRAPLISAQNGREVCDNLYNAGDYVSAAECYLSIDPPDYWWASDSYGWAGNIAYQQGDYTTALNYYLLEIQYAELSGDSLRKGYAYYHAGQTSYALGNLEDAKSYYLQAANNYVQVPDYWWAADSYGWAGNIAYEQGDYESALNYYLSSAENFIKVPDYKRTGDSYHLAGNAANAKGDCVEATKYWNLAKQYYDLAGYEYTIPSCVMVSFLDKENPSCEVVGAAADGASKVIIQISNLPQDITPDKVQINIAEGDGYLDNNAAIRDGVFTQTYNTPDYFVRDGFPEDISQGKREIGLTIKVNGQEIDHPKFYLIKPPIVLLHGLWSNPNTWDTLKSRLEASHGYQYIIAYSYPNSNHFDQLNSVIGNAIYLALGLPKIDNFVAKKADVVAHSMGGLITKLFGHESKIHSITTVGTPHYGSPLADILWPLVDEADQNLFERFIANLFLLSGHPVTYGAIEDLRESGGKHVEAGRIKVPVKVISGYSPLTEQTTIKFINILANVFKFSQLLSWSATLLDLNQLIFGGEQNDWVVSDSSQEGGCIGDDDPVFWHCSEPTDDEVLQKIIDFLHRTGSTGLCSLSPLMKSQEIHELQYTLQKIQMGVSSGQVQITQPIEGQVFQAGDPVNVEISVSNENSVVLITTSTGESALIEHAPYNFQFLIPDEVIGQLTILVGARDDSGFIASDEVTINIASTANLIDIKVYPEIDPLSLPIGATVPLIVYGFYDDGITREITSSGCGTSYISSDPNVMEVSLAGLLTAKSQGEAIVTIENSGVRKEITVIGINLCEGDFDGDGDVDGSDLAVFAADFGRTDCKTGSPCEGDFDGDGDVDGSDLAIFAADFGRTDCP